MRAWLIYGLLCKLAMVEISWAAFAPRPVLRALGMPGFMLALARHVFGSIAPTSPCTAAEIDDYVFEPCGYSMNGVECGTFSTIHITPEDGEAVYNGRQRGRAVKWLGSWALHARA